MNAISLAETLFAVVLYTKINIIGEYGDKFYVILDGTVSVLVPQKKKQTEEPPTL